MSQREDADNSWESRITKESDDSSWESRIQKEPVASSAKESDSSWETRINQEAPKEETPELHIETPKGTALKSQPITPTEVSYLADKYKLTGEDREALKSYVPWATPGDIYTKTEEGKDKEFSEMLGEAGKSAVSAVSRGVLFNIPQKLYKMSQDNENLQKAMDEMDELASEKRSYLLGGLTYLGGGAAAAKAASSAVGKLAAAELPGVTGTVAKAVNRFINPTTAEESIASLAGTGAATGALSGFGSSRAGEEVSGTALGTALGGVAGGTLGALGQHAKEAFKVAKETPIGKFISNKAFPAESSVVDGVVAESTAAAAAAEPKLTERAGAIFTDAVDAKINSPKYQKILEAQVSNVEEAVKAIQSGAEEIPAHINMKAFDRLSREVRDATGKDINSFIVQGKASPELNAVVKEIATRREFNKIAPLVASHMNNTARLGTVEKLLVDGLPLSKVISENTGMDLTTPIQELSKNMNKEKAVQLVALDAVKGLETGKQTFTEALGSISASIEKEFGAKPPAFLDSYVPRQRKQFIDWASSAVLEAKKLGIEFIPSVKKGTVFAPKEPIGQSIQWRVKVPENLEIPEEFSKELMKMTQKESVADALTSVRNLDRGDVADVIQLNNRYLARIEDLEGAIPSWARETNPSALLLSYAKSVAGTEARREPLLRLEAIAKVLKGGEKTGGPLDINAHAWVQNLVDDLKGIPRKTVTGESDRVLQSIPTQDSARQRKIFDRVVTLKEELAKEVPDPVKVAEQVRPLAYGALGNHLTSLIYANTLASPKTALTNLMSPMTVGAPWLSSHIGAGNAHRLAGASMLKAMKDFTLQQMGKKGNLVQEAIDRGLVHKEFSGEQIKQLKEGIVDGLLKEATDKGMSIGTVKSARLLDTLAETYTNTALAMFSASEKIARAASLDMAKKSADLLLKRPKLRASFLDSITDAATHNNLLNSMTSAIKDPKAKDKFITDVALYLNRETMFNYDRANLNELGRSAGPWLSMFTKWPAKIGGDIYANYKIRGAAKGTDLFAKQLLAPFVTYTAIGAALSASVDEGSPEAASYKALIKDMSSKTMLSSLTGLTDKASSGYSNPMMALVGGTAGLFSAAAKAAESGDTRDFEKIAGNINKYIGVGGVQKAADDFSLIFTGESLFPKDRYREK